MKLTVGQLSIVFAEQSVDKAAKMMPGEMVNFQKVNSIIR